MSIESRALTDSAGDRIVIESTDNTVALTAYSGGDDIVVGPFTPAALRAAVDAVAPAPVHECPNPSAHEDREDDVTLLRHDLALMERRAEKAEENVKAREEMINRLAVRAEKAEMERDKARAERDEATAELMAEQSRGFTAEDVTTDRAITHRAMAVLHRIGYMASEATTADTLRAALTEPPARPEGAEELGELIGTWTATEDIAPAQLPTGSLATLADFLAERGVRVVGEEQP